MKVFLFDDMVVLHYGRILVGNFRDTAVMLCCCLPLPSHISGAGMQSPDEDPLWLARPPPGSADVTGTLRSIRSTHTFFSRNMSTAHPRFPTPYSVVFRIPAPNRIRKR